MAEVEGSVKSFGDVLVWTEVKAVVALVMVCTIRSWRASRQTASRTSLPALRSIFSNLVSRVLRSVMETIASLSRLLNINGVEFPISEPAPLIDDEGAPLMLIWPTSLPFLSYWPCVCDVWVGPEDEISVRRRRLFVAIDPLIDPFVADPPLALQISPARGSCRRPLLFDHFFPSIQVLSLMRVLALHSIRSRARLSADRGVSRNLPGCARSLDRSSTCAGP